MRAPPSSARSIEAPSVPTVAMPRDAGRAGPRDELAVGRLAGVEVAVGVDHRRRPGAQAAGASASTSGKLAELAERCAAGDGAEARAARATGPRLPERVEQPLRRLGHERMQQHRHHAQTLGQRVEHLVEVLGLGVVLGQLPGLLFLDVAVEALDPPPDLLERRGELDAVQAAAHRVGQPVEVLPSAAAGSASGTTPSR